MSLTLIRNADVYAPDALGVQQLLLGGGRILWIGSDLPDVARGACRSR